MSNIYSVFKRRIKLKNTFQRLIFSCIAIISVILLIASFVLYNGYKNQIIEQSNITAVKLLNQAEYYSEYTLQWATSYMYQLYLDKDVYDIIFNNGPAKSSADTGLNKIRQFVGMQQSAQSIYLYNSNMKMVFPSDGESSNYFNFYDKDIHRLLQENDETLSTKFIPRQITTIINGREYVKNVLTLVLSNVKSSDTNIPYGAIILNLDANNIQNYYKNITENDYSIIVIDSKGRVVLNSNQDLFLKDISDKDYIKKVLASKPSEGSFFSTVNGKPSVVSYKTSDRMGLKFINIIPYKTLTGSLNRMLKLLACTSIVLFLLSIAAAFVSFKRIYAPIDRTIKTVREYLKVYESSESDSNVDTINELNEDDKDYLTKVINILISRPIQINKLESADLRFIKKQLLTGLLFNTPFEIKSFKTKLQELEAKIDFYNIVVLVFEFDSYNKLQSGYTREESETIKSCIYSEAANIIATHYKSELVVTDEDAFCVIINVGEKYDNAAISNIMGLVEDIQNFAYSNYIISISAAIGNYVEDIIDTTRSYKSAREYICYKFKYGFRSILYKEKIDAGIYSSIKYDYDQEEAVFKELRAGNMLKVEAELEKLFENIMKLSYRDMLVAISHFFDNSQKAITGMLQISRSTAQIQVEKFYDNIDRFQTIDYTKLYLLRLYLNVINQMREKKKNRKNEITESVTAYINENYSNPLLSPETIAANLNISLNYLRVLFKENEGKSLSSYISEVRFEKAKALLESTDMTAAEISFKIGFANDNYFYTAFKKYYGVSPNQYRNSIKLA